MIRQCLAQHPADSKLVPSATTDRLDGLDHRNCPKPRKDRLLSSTLLKTNMDPGNGTWKRLFSSTNQRFSGSMLIFQGVVSAYRCGPQSCWKKWLHLGLFAHVADLKCFLDEDGWRASKNRVKVVTLSYSKQDQWIKQNMVLL